MKKKIPITLTATVLFAAGVLWIISKQKIPDTSADETTNNIITQEDHYDSIILAKEKKENMSGEIERLTNAESETAQDQFIYIPDHLNISAQDQKAIQDNYAAVSQNRKQIIKTAASLIDQIPYEWGGKSKKKGVDESWGEIIDEQTGQRRGLDCSGFVQWVFRTSGYHDKTWTKINCTSNILVNTWEISKEELIPGDLGLLNHGETINHVGIYLGNDYWIHCSGSARTVTINKFPFTIYRRVSTINEESLCSPEEMCPVKPIFSALDYYPELEQFWDEEGNYPLIMDDIYYSSKKEYEWTCTYGHHWKESLESMYKNKTCPVCAQDNERIQ